MAIEVEIYGRNLEIKEDIRDYVDKKVAKLDRYLNGIEEARVDLAYSKSARSNADRQIAQITVQGKGFILRSEERAETYTAALDQALEKIQRRIERFKGKRLQRSERRPPEEVVPTLAPDLMDGDDDEDFTPVIARRKKFTLIPMDEMEALEQMTLLGHNSFFVFYNANTNMVNVLYKRRDGAFGLIEPEIG